MSNRLSDASIASISNGPGRPPATERQELLAMVKACLEAATAQADAITALSMKVAALEEKVSIAAGQYRQRAMAE